MIKSSYHSQYIGFPTMGDPLNGLFIRENPIEMDDLRVAPFMETIIWGCGI